MPIDHVTIPTLTPHQIHLFERHIKQDCKGGCWNWTASKSKKGYGRIRIARQNYQSHRVAWALVLHRCDNPSCVNPKHLFLGTPLDNMNDMKSKGRARHRSPHWTKNPAVRLTPEKVADIRTRYARGGVSTISLAADFSVSISTINHVIRRMIWKHVD